MASLLRKVKAKVDEARQSSNSNDLSQDEEATLVQKLAKEHPVQDTASEHPSSQPEGTSISDQFSPSRQPGDDQSLEKAPQAISSEKQDVILGDSQLYRPGLVPNQGQQKPGEQLAPADKLSPETPAPDDNTTGQLGQQETAEPDHASKEGAHEPTEQQKPLDTDDEAEKGGAVEPSKSGDIGQEAGNGENDHEQREVAGPNNDRDENDETEKQQEPRKQAFSSPDEANAALNADGEACKDDDGRESTQKEASAGQDTADMPASNGDETAMQPAQTNGEAPAASQPATQRDKDEDMTLAGSSEPENNEEDASKNIVESKTTDDTTGQSSKPEDDEEVELNHIAERGVREDEPSKESDRPDGETEEQSKPDAAPTSEEQDHNAKNQPDDAPPSTDDGDADKAPKHDKDAEKSIGDGDDTKEPTEGSRDAEKSTEYADSERSTEDGAVEEPTEHSLEKERTTGDDGEAEHATKDGDDAEKPAEDKSTVGTSTDEAGKSSIPIKSTGSGKDDGHQQREDQAEGEQDENLDGSQAIRPGVEDGNVVGPDNGDGGRGAEHGDDKKDGIEEAQTNEKDRDNGEEKPDETGTNGETKGSSTAQEPEGTSEIAKDGGLPETAGKDIEHPTGDMDEEEKEDSKPSQGQGIDGDQEREPSKPSNNDGEEDGDDEDVYPDSEKQRQREEPEEADDQQGNDVGQSQDGAAGPEKGADSHEKDQTGQAEENVPKDQGGKEEADKEASNARQSAGKGTDNQSQDEPTERPDGKTEKPETSEQTDGREDESKPSEEGGDAYEDDGNHSNEAAAGGAVGAAAIAGGAYGASKSHDDDKKKDDDEEKKDSNENREGGEEGDGGEKRKDVTAGESANEHRSEDSEQQSEGKNEEGAEGKSAEPENKDGDQDETAEEAKKQNGEMKPDEQRDTSEPTGPSYGKEEPSSSDSDEQTKAALDAHNKAREEKGAQQLEWDDDLAEQASKQAQKLAESRKLHHSGDAEQGENLYVHVEDVSYGDAVKAWLAEEEDYHGGRFGEGNAVKYGHFTQCMWHSTTHVGIAKARSRNGSTFIVAKYWPQGNVVGEKPF